MELLNTLIGMFGGNALDLSSFGTAGLVVTLIISLLMCFFGYNLLRVFVAIVGASLGIFLGNVIAGKAGLNDSITMIVIVVFAVGICLLSFFLYRMGVFILTFFISFAFLTMLISMFVQDTKTAIISGLVAGIVLGACSCIFIRPLTVFSTAIGGGMGVSYTVISKLAAMTGQTATIITLVLGMVVAILGIIVQFRLSKKRKR